MNFRDGLKELGLFLATSCMLLGLLLGLVKYIDYRLDQTFDGFIAVDEGGSR